jgi:CubicO group peptidase (beta-lactamase class C family)
MNLMKKQKWAVVSLCINPLTVLSLLSSALGNAAGQTIPEIQAIIRKEMDAKHIPAMAVAIIREGKIIHLSADGYRDLENHLPANIDTPFHISSVSKSVINLAVFQLVEAGRIDPQSDINAYLPFPIVNPHFPSEKITVQDVLNHRAGIKDDEKFFDPFWNHPQGDPKIELADFIKDYLYVEGKFYNPGHFADGANHKSFEYSNTGYALLGLMIEHLSGVSLEEYSRANIFKPLGMKNSSWFLRFLDLGSVAKTYASDGSGGLTFKGHNGYPDYPAGQLRTSISDFAKLIGGYLNAKDTPFILKFSTIDRITPIPQIAHNGFTTWFMISKNSHTYYANEGGDIGVHAQILMDVRKRNAIAVFINSEADLDDILNSIENIVFK